MALGRDKFAVWSPHRDSNSVVAFKSTLGLRTERWVWHDEPQRATWWLIDGLRDPDSELTKSLINARSAGLVHGALLAPDWSVMRDPAWAFFKVPLLSKGIYSWVDSCLLLHPALPAWDGHQLKLRRWPNMSRYSVENDPGAAVLLTAACAQLLKDFTSYEDLLRTVPQRSTIDLLLTDALRDGILEMARRPAPAPAPAPADMNRFNSSLLTSKDSSAWSLVKRLISKFS